jgi:alkylation response protein AidB-like acyl-CoA dehydrogenase
MRLGLRALNRLAGLEALDRFGLRGPAERLLFRASKTTAATATRIGRTWNGGARLTKAVRPSPAQRGDLFDLTPTDEQQMLRESFAAFAAERLRPAAQEADRTCAASDALLAEAAELGVATVGIPEELGGVVGERSAVTSVLIAEALAHGDMGIAFAALAPAAVTTALGLWGDADQQSRYVPPFLEDEPPAAALALLEPRPLFDPLALETRARAAEGDYVLDGSKSLVPRAADAELFVVAARMQDGGTGLFIVESGAEGLSTAAERAMGVRAAATGRVLLDGVRVPEAALLGGGDPAVYGECVQRARLGWCALAVGTAQAVLDYVIPYVNERTAFGEPISNRQAVAFAVADMAIELDGMRLLTWRAASRADQGRDFAREAALARKLCAEKGMAIGSDGIQLLGGHGFVKEHPVERWYRDLRGAGLMEGALLV